MHWIIIGSVLLVAILGALVFLGSRGGKHVNDYFANAVKTFAITGDEAAAVAAVTAAKVAASDMRTWMVAYVSALISHFSRPPNDEKIQNESKEAICHRLQRLSSEITKKLDWTIDDIRGAKDLLSKMDVQYLRALNRYDPSVFQTRWPQVFEASERDVFARLARDIASFPTLERQKKRAVVQSTPVLQDMLRIPKECWEIVEKYGEVLANQKRLLKPLSSLPYPKDAIASAIETALSCSSDPELQRHLKDIRFALEDFVPDENLPTDPEKELENWIAHRSKKRP
jgi:hypothetical protein